MYLCVYIYVYVCVCVCVYVYIYIYITTFQITLKVRMEEKQKRRGMCRSDRFTCVHTYIRICIYESAYIYIYIYVYIYICIYIYIYTSYVSCLLLDFLRQYVLLKFAAFVTDFPRIHRDNNSSNHISCVRRETRMIMQTNRSRCSDDLSRIAAVAQMTFHESQPLLR